MDTAVNGSGTGGGLYRDEEDKDMFKSSRFRGLGWNVCMKPWVWFLVPCTCAQMHTHTHRKWQELRCGAAPQTAASPKLQSWDFLLHLKGSLLDLCCVCADQDAKVQNGEKVCCLVVHLLLVVPGTEPGPHTCWSYHESRLQSCPSFQSRSRIAMSENVFRSHRDCLRSVTSEWKGSLDIHISASMNFLFIFFVHLLNINYQEFSVHFRFLSFVNQKHG